ncbi:hypothetical protein THOM_1579 [Trachipleistophora hominis]|uniref:Uncharacterized protein n=1 Tax=Trachipleistophora hominis TaxID=72359 RepID=L7JVY4_TRAHO|nr:hypothetical protein THOM_1579 [Trachipleistophora hominis]
MNDNAFNITVSSNEKDAPKMLDGNDYTCWSPSLRAPHYIRINSMNYFGEIVLINQAGYNCRTIAVRDKTYLFDEDAMVQVINLDEHVNGVEIKIVDTWDPYGRVCIYNMFLK